MQEMPYVSSNYHADRHYYPRKKLKTGLQMLDPMTEAIQLVKTKVKVNQIAC
jgi:hypothetical protein